MDRRLTYACALALLLALFPASQASTRSQEEVSTCRKALGMNSGLIPDDAITASSAFDMKSVGPMNARIRTEANGGAWCPEQQIAPDVYEWLQVDLGQIKVVTLVETQGRFGNGQGQEYAPQYLLEYQRLNEGRWLRYRGHEGDEILKGNSNTYIAEMRELRPPIIARRLRFIPYSSHRRTVCMRVELYGCPWKDGTMSYSMRQGDRRGAEVDLYDFYYDGKVEDAFLSGGLGQLTDWEEGNTNFRLDVLDLGRKGYEWVGWKNDSLTALSQPVEVVFDFDVLRNFSAVHIHCNNLFSKDVRVFSRAEVYFSVGGRYFSGNPVHYEYLRDTVIEIARYVIIPIPNRVGRKVKLLLFFDARWIMVSEVRFDSEPAKGNFTDETSPLPTLYPHKQRTIPRDSNEPELRNRGPQMVNVDLMPGDAPRLNSPSPTSDNFINSGAHHKKSNMDDTYIGIIIGTVVALFILIASIVIIVIFRQRRRKFHTNPIKTIFGTDHLNFHLNDLSPGNGKVSHGNMYNAIATNEDSSDKESSGVKNNQQPNGDSCEMHNRSLPDLPPKTPETDTNPDYAETNKYSPLVVSLPTQPLYHQPPLSNQRNSTQSLPKASAFSPPGLLIPANSSTMPADLPACSIQGLIGNSVYAVPSNTDLVWREDTVSEFPREKLKFVEKLGEGQFGEVHLCEALGVSDIVEDDLTPPGRAGAPRSLLVAVKMLRQQASEAIRSDFHKEVRVMSQLRDPNIVRVLGVCTRDEPLAVVVEYMKFGDLNQFLQQHVPEGSTLAARPGQHTLSYGCLIFMATQITSGMKYLETLNMVHRDLATRNCLVGPQATIKISDFGMSRSLYNVDYYRIEGKAVLPIRWMAWESVLLGKFSCKSDVWSMAVTLWEVLTFAREQPFDALNDEQVIENCGHYYRSDGQELCLPQPSNCPKEIYDLMCECWNRDELQRPSFREMHMFLSRKNMGYNPRDELQGCGRSAAPVV